MPIFSPFAIKDICILYCDSPQVGEETGQAWCVGLAPTIRNSGVQGMDVPCLPPVSKSIFHS